MIYGRASSCRTYNVMEESTLKNIIDRIAKNSVFDTIFVNFRCTIGDLTLGTGFHGKPFFSLLHKYPLFIGSLERSDRAESGISRTFEKKYFLVKL